MDEWKEKKTEFQRFRYVKSLNEILSIAFGAYANIRKCMVFLSNVTHFPFYDHHRCSSVECVCGYWNGITIRNKERITFRSTGKNTTFINQILPFFFLSCCSAGSSIHSVAFIQQQRSNPQAIHEFIGSIIGQSGKKHNNNIKLRYTKTKA